MILILPHGTAAAVAVGDGAITLPGHDVLDLEAALAGLHPDEATLAASLAPRRRPEWVAGRLALRTALASAGLACDGPVLGDDRGAPVLPAAARGSISHKRGLAVALAAAADADERVGVDVELHGSARIDISPRILTDAERAAVDLLDPVARARAVTLRFALKEAVYKAIDPFLRRYVGFREVEVWPEGARARVDPGALPVLVEAAWIEIGDVIVCSARARSTS